MVRRATAAEHPNIVGRVAIAAGDSGLDIEVDDGRVSSC